MHQSRWYRTQIHEAAIRHGLDPLVVEAVVRVESSGLAHAYRYEPAFWDRYLANDPDYAQQNPRRVSASYGLMQVMLSTARQHGFRSPDPETLFVPIQSLFYGCAHLASLVKWSGGDIKAALAAYNGGKPGNRRPPYRNRGYVEKVMAALEQIKKDPA